MIKKMKRNNINKKMQRNKRKQMTKSKGIKEIKKKMKRNKDRYCL